MIALSGSEFFVDMITVTSLTDRLKKYHHQFFPENDTRGSAYKLSRIMVDSGSYGHVCPPTVAP